MIQYFNRKNHYDFIHKFQWIQTNFKPKLIRISIDNNNNILRQKSDSIFIHYYHLLLLFHQKPFIKKTNRNIANFNLKPNNITGLLLNINKYAWINIIYYIKPNIHKHNTSITTQYYNQYYNIKITYGLKQINYNLNYDLQYKAGAHFSFYFKSPVNYTPFF